MRFVSVWSWARSPQWLIAALHRSMLSCQSERANQDGPQPLPAGVRIPAHRSDHTLSFVFVPTALGNATIIEMAGADSTLRTSRAVPHPNTSRDLCRLTPEVERHPANSTRCGRQRPRWLQVGPRLASIFATLCEVFNAK